MHLLYKTWLLSASLPQKEAWSATQPVLSRPNIASANTIKAITMLYGIAEATSTPEVGWGRTRPTRCFVGAAVRLAHVERIGAMAAQRLLLATRRAKLLNQKTREERRGKTADA